MAIAIIYQEDQFLMQLRDEVPNIVYPGHWGLFGGHIEASETPEKALLSRENIIQGYCYSHQANQIKPLGKPHQQIILDFIAANII